MLKIKKTILAICVVFLILGIASCTQTLQQEKQLPAQQKQAEKITDTKAKTKIGFLPITDHLLLGISKERDGANFKNLELETTKFGDWATISEALRSGNLDGAFLLAPLAYQSKLKDAPVKVVMLGHRDGSALIVKVRDGINTVKDLKGTTIAIPHRFST